MQETYFARQFVFESSVMDLPGYFGETASAPKPLPNPKMEMADSLTKDEPKILPYSIRKKSAPFAQVAAVQIPHPEKVAKGGEDAYFISQDKSKIGVFDGNINIFK